MKMTFRHVCGGLGDMLLSLESAIQDRVIDIFSHFQNAPAFYQPLGVTINRCEYFSSLEELGSLDRQGDPLPRTRYPKFNLPKAPIDPPSGKPIIGIHIEGSKFSNNAARSGGKPIKDMSPCFLDNLVDALNSKWAFPYVFCSPAKYAEVSRIFREKYQHPFKVIAFEDIWASLACVGHCRCVLATDSAIKTMAAILWIPSVVLVADYPDSFRDEIFLSPYVKDGLMRIVKYRDMDALNPRNIIESL